LKYTVVTLRFAEDNTELAEILVAELSLFGFDSFEENAGEVKAYIPTNLWPVEGIAEVMELTQKYNVSFCGAEELPDKDWNEVWESQFEPVVIANRCLLYASFHTNLPKYEYEIKIDPKMAFGTGHHDTTAQIMELMLEQDFSGLNVLDMGCGTGILSILAEMRGATNILAIDNDEWACRNAQDNIALNHCQKIEVKLGDANSITDQQFDVILANINRNIILADIALYVKSLKKNGKLFLSGFYVEDIPMIHQSAETLGLERIDVRDRKKWAALCYTLK
jgi:ribosomal protein L11 methyltransferase